MFNNRELATGVWLLMLGAFLLSKREIRASVRRLLRAFFQWKILLSVGCMVLYVAGVVAVLWLIGFWQPNLTKDTAVWLAFSAFAMVLDFVTSGRDENVCRKIFFDNVKVVILVEFLINTYTFSFLGELVFVPCVTVIVLLDVVARTDEQYAQVARFTAGLLAIIGLAVFAFAISKAIADFRNLGRLDTVRSVALAPILSLAFSPFIYILLLVTTYELVFLRLRIGAEKASDVIGYARRRIMLRHGLRLNQLRAFLRRESLDLMRIRTRTDVDNLLDHDTN